MKKNTSKKSNKTFLSKHYPLLIILALLVLLVASVSILLNLRNNPPIESDDDYVTVPGGPDGFTPPIKSLSAVTVSATFPLTVFR